MWFERTAAGYVDLPGVFQKEVQLAMKVRCGDKYIERPLRELVGEALIAPFFVLSVLWAMRGGTGH